MSDGCDDYRRGLELLAAGNYSEGFALYEGRRGGINPVLNPAQQWPGLRCPEWQGEELSGKHVLVFGEQGFGDSIMFARFIPSLHALGATVTYVCGSGLERLFPNGHVARKRHDFPPGHYWSLVGSLPHKLGVALDTLPPPHPIDRAAQRHGGVGVVPSGRPTHENDANRSLDPQSAARLLELGRDLRPEATGARDFAETADIIAALDLVITVDTSVAHLAGSMGKAVWVLLPAHGVDWRWMRDRMDSPWYPSARLFRQGPAGEWPAVIAEVEAALT